jgi:hypothetical protein
MKKSVITGVAGGLGDRVVLAKRLAGDAARVADSEYG